MQMNMLGLTLTVIFSLWICSAHGDTVKYSSGCTVDLCTPNSTNNNNANNSNGNVTCPNIALCYLFQTSINTTLCAPQVVCSLFDPCTITKKCATNTSVCVINTCCSAPVCMPLALTSSCSMYINTKIQTPSSGNICPNATWNDNSTIIITGNLNGTYWTSFPDFVLDNNNNLYSIDQGSYRVLKFALNNPSVFSVAAITSYSSTYQAASLYVDGNGTIYTSESSYQYANMMYSYQISKYNQNGGTTGTVLFGPTTCGTNITQMCGCSSLFVDSTGSIYCSDSSNQRVLKITPFATSASVIAGISGSAGSTSNQLSNPSGIYVDGTGALYVADQGNARVMKFTSGNSIGTALFILPSYQSPMGLALDSAGSIYTGTYSGIFKWVVGSSSATQIISQVTWGITRIRLDINGNIYTSGYSSSNIYRYNITSNSC